MKNNAMKNFLKKTDFKVVGILLGIIVISTLLVMEPEQTRTVQTESFQYEDVTKETDLTSILAQKDAEWEERFKNLQTTTKKTQDEMKDLLYGFQRENVVKVMNDGDDKIVTLKNGDIFRVKVGTNDIVKEQIGTLYSQNKKSLGNIVNEILLPNGDSIIETADGKKWLLKANGELIELDSFSVDENGNYILKTKDGETLVISDEGIAKAYKTADGTYKIISDKELVDKDGNRFINDINGAYMIDKDGNKVKIGNEVFVDKWGNTFVKRDDGIYQFKNKEWARVADELYQLLDLTIYLKIKDAIYIVNKDGSFTKVGNNLTIDKDGNVLIDGKIVGKLKNSILPIFEGSVFKNLKKVDKKIKSGTLKTGEKFVQERDGVYKIDVNGRKTKVGNNLTIDENGNIFIDGKLIGESILIEDLESALLDKNGHLLFALETVFDSDGTEYLYKIFKDENGDKTLKTVAGVIVKTKDAWFDENSNLIYIDLNNIKHVLQKSRDFFIGPNGELILNKIFTDENGNKYLLTANGERIYVDDAYFDEDGNLIYTKDGITNKLSKKYGTVFDQNGKEFIDNIFEDENGKYMLDMNGNKVYLDNITKDENGNLIVTDKDGNKHLLKNGKSKLFKMINDLESAELENGVRYIQTPDGVFMIDKYGNKIKVGEKMWIDENGNLVIDGKIIGKAKNYKLSSNGTLEMIGEGNIFKNENGDNVISFSKVYKVYLGKLISGFTDKSGNYYEEKDGRVLRNNKYFERGKLFYKASENSVFIFYNQEIVKTLKGVNEVNFRGLSIKTKDGDIFKLLNMKQNSNDGIIVKKGNIIKLSENGNITDLEEGTIKINGKMLNLSTIKGLKEFKEIDFIKSSKGYFSKDYLLIDNINTYSLVNLNNIENTETYYKIASKLGKGETNYILKTFNNNNIYLGDILTKTEIKVNKEETKYQIEDKIVENGIIVKGELTNSIKKTAYILNNGEIVFNLNDNKNILTQLPSQNFQTIINGTLSVQNNKLYLTPNSKEIDLGVTTNIYDLVNINGFASFKYADNFYLINKNGYKSLGKGKTIVKKGEMYFSDDKTSILLGKIRTNSLSMFNNIEFNSKGAFLERKQTEIEGLKGNYAVFGEFFTLVDHKKVFYNESNEIMVIDKMSKVQNLGLANLIVYNINDKEVLFMLQEGNYVELGEVINKSVSNNSIYKTTKGLYYVTNNNINQLEENELFNLKLTPMILDSKLYGFDNTNTRVFLGDILNVLTGEFIKRGSSSFDENIKNVNIQQIIKGEDGSFFAIDENGNKIKLDFLTKLPNGSLKIRDGLGNERTISQDLINVKNKNFLVSDNPLNDIIEVYKDDNNIWWGVRDNGEKIRLAKVVILSDGSLRITDMKGNQTTLHYTSLIKDKERYNISSNPLNNLKRVLKGINKNYRVTKNNEVIEITSLIINSEGNIIIKDNKLNKKEIDVKYIERTQPGFIIETNPLNKIVSITKKDNRWKATNSFSNQIPLYIVTKNDGQFKLVDNKGNTRIVEKNEVINEKSSFRFSLNPLNRIESLKINANGIWEGRNLIGEILLLENVIELSDKIKIEDSKGNIRYINNSNINSKTETSIQLKNSNLELISKLFKNDRGEWLAVDIKNDEVKIKSLSENNIGNLIIEHNNGYIKEIDSSDILSYEEEYTFSQKTLGSLKRVYNEDGNWKGVDTENNVINILKINKNSDGSLTIIDNNNLDINIPNTKLEGIIEEYIIFSNLLDNLVSVQQDDSMNWFGIDEVGKKINLKSVSRISDDSYKIIDEFGNIRIIDSKKIIKTNNSDFNIKDNILNNITELKHDKKSNIWEAEIKDIKDVRLKDVKKLENGDYTVTDNNNNFRIIGKNDISLDIKTIVFANNQLNSVIEVNKNVANKWIGITENGDNIPLISFSLNTNGVYEIVSYQNEVRYISSANVERDGDVVRIFPNGLEQIKIIKQNKNGTYEGILFNGSGIQIADFQTGENIITIFDNIGNKISISTLNIVSDIEIFKVKINPLSDIVKVWKDENGIWWGLTADGRKIRLKNVKILPDGTMILIDENGNEFKVSSAMLDSDMSTTYKLKDNPLNNIKGIYQDENGNWYAIDEFGNKILLKNVEVLPDGSIKITDENGNVRIIGKDKVIEDSSNYSISKGKAERFGIYQDENGNWYKLDENGNKIYLKSVEELPDGSLRIVDENGNVTIVSKNEIDSVDTILDEYEIIKGADGKWYKVDKNGNKILLDNVEELSNGNLRIVDKDGNITIVKRNNLVKTKDGYKVKDFKKSYKIKTKGEEKSKNMDDTKLDNIKSIKKINGEYFISDDNNRLHKAKVETLSDGSLKVEDENGNSKIIDKKNFKIDGQDFIIKSMEEENKQTFMKNKDLNFLFGKPERPKEKTPFITPTNNKQDNSRVQTQQNNLFNKDKNKVELLVINSTAGVEKNKLLFTEQLSYGNYNSDGTKIESKEIKFMLPIGTRFDVSLKGGAMAPVEIGDSGGDEDSGLFADNMSIFEVTGNVTDARGNIIPLKGAYISAKPVATNIQRMVFELQQINFYDHESEKWLLAEIKGQLFFNGDGVPGIPGIVIDKKDEYLAKATIYSVLQGVTDYMVATKSPINAISTLSDTSSTSSTTSSESGLGESLTGGMSDGLTNITDSIMAVANRQVPMLVIKGNQEAVIEIYEPIIIGEYNY